MVLTKVSEVISKMNSHYYDKYEKKLRAAWQNRLLYDSTSETLEPIYFWILDFVDSAGWKTEKLIDNFTASPGSGYFAEIGARATRMQDEGMKIFGTVNAVLKSVINIIYDLKEFEIRLKHYESAKSNRPAEREAAILALKQIWMDNVDIKRGRGSINMLTYELSFTTLRDAFMKAASIEDVDRMDLNERVKRILKPRVAEFFEWWKRSETELKKRYEIEKSYLKSQVNAIKLYSRWAKPYFKAAEQLRMKEVESPNLINIFNTVLLELSLFCKKKIDIREAAYNKQLPLNFARKKFSRDYYACIFIDFLFRGIPRRISPQEAHYVFGGRSDMEFIAVCLNDDELALLKNELDKDDINDALRMVEIATTESMDQMRMDIEYFLKEKERREEIKKEQLNPFSALFSFGKRAKAKTEEEKAAELKKKGIRKDSYAEKIIRAHGEMEASNFAFSVFDVYKKAHDMASMPGGVDFYEYFKGSMKWKPGF